MSGIQSGGVRAATQQVEDALLQEYDQIAGGVSKYALLAQKYGLDSESSFMHKSTCQAPISRGDFNHLRP